MIGRFHLGYIDFELANNGLLAGLVSITASCATVEMEGAFCIGMIASMFFYVATQVLQKYKIDDVVDAFPVHGASGLWGVIAAGLFTTEDNYRKAYASEYSDGEDRAKHCAGVFYGGDGSQLGANLVLALVVIAWVGGISTIIFGVSSKLGLLRIKSEKENFGLDYAHHSNREERERIKAASPDYASISPDFVSGRGGKDSL
jgi:Amt family ammonium transporter